MEKLAEAGFEVTNACWVKTTEDRPWHLYLVSPVVDNEGRKEAYRRIHGVIWEMASSSTIDPFEVKLIGSKSPVAQGAADMVRRYPGVNPIRSRSADFGGQSIEAAYFYPSRLSAPVS